MTGILGRLAMLALLALAGGCATTPQWEHYTASNRIESPEKGFTLQAPAGWRRSPGEAGDRIVLTADGAGIQQLVLGRFSLDKAFALTKGKATPQTSPRELGELVLAEIRAGSKGSALELKSAGETRIDGRPAFLLRVTERTQAGVQYERIVAGTHGQSKMFWASCKALTRYFFERARPVCEQAIESVRLTGL